MLLPTATLPEPVFTTQEELHDVARARHIVILDDSPTVCKILETVLRREQFTVTTFSSAHSLYVYLVNNPDITIDLFLIDLLLPKSDGYTVTRTIKRRKQYASIPVIILTPFENIFEKIRVRLSGACDYILKPFKTHEAVELIAKVLKIDRKKYKNVQLDIKAQQGYGGYAPEQQQRRA